MTKKTSFVGLTAATLLLGVFLLLLLQIIVRYLKIQASWTEELIRWLWIWSVCLGIVEAERQNEQLSICYFVAKISKKSSSLLLLYFDLLTLAMFLILVWLSILTFIINWDTQAAIIPFSRSYLYLSLLISSLLTAYATAKKIFKKRHLFRNKLSCTDLIRKL